MKEVKKIECPKCGFSNVYGISKCIKCNTLLKSYLVCPRCAKKNELETKKCVNCGYKFGRKKTSILFNLIIAVVLVGLLFVISKLKILLDKIKKELYDIYHDISFGHI